MNNKLSKLKQLEAGYIQKQTEAGVFKKLPEFEVGNTVKVSYRIVEGDKERVQPFEGVVISIKKGRSNINSTFIVRRVNQGFGVERIFPLYSPRIESIEVLKDNYVRRSKLYYLRELVGKAARLKDRSRRSRNIRKQASEVKTASADTPGDPLLRVTPKKIQRIKRAAGHYLRSSAGKTDALKRQPRYDIITVRTNADGKNTVQHYPNAIRFD
ncbi:hypothetical protein CHS0354_018370 [Potamilus streckersoni]|uniref:Large ribosomal subunit protein bL19m n=1 Tax=Potamilus streckersoni TaxID=2493646 RepID=A0AAE0TAS2_9BIVA|nr:hypothetical protein CHS0354_018370 [Potamilus streckersoni]